MVRIGPHSLPVAAKIIRFCFANGERHRVTCQFHVPTQRRRAHSVALI